MDNPRPEKVAVVAEVRERLQEADASVVTEYRGLSVAALAELRRSLTAAGGDYKVYKNTLVRLAVAGSEHQPIESLLTGPTAIAFVQGDVSAVAKALRDFARAHPHLVVKGGFFDGTLLSASDLNRLADLPPREVLLAQLAGALAAPLRTMAGLLQALPRNLAYGLAALADQRRAGEPAEAVEAPEDAPAEAPAETAEAPEDAPAEAPAETAEAPAETAEPEDAPADAPADAAAPAGDAG